MPYIYKQLDNHAKVAKKKGTVTAPGYLAKVSKPVKQDANYKVRKPRKGE